MGRPLLMAVEPLEAGSGAGRATERSAGGFSMAKLGQGGERLIE